MKKARETKGMYVTRPGRMIPIPEPLMNDLDEMIKWEGVSIEEVLHRAVTHYRHELERRKIDAEAEAYKRKHPHLRAKYLGRYVAMHDGRVVDSDRDLDALNKRIRTRFGRTPVLMRLVEEQPERVLVFRSPRLEPAK